MRYLVRSSCEYSIVVDAECEDEALNKAGETDFNEWHSCEYSPLEIEEYD